MSTVDPNQEPGDAGEAKEPKEGEVQESTTPESQPNSDPLDAIEDEVVRNDMKRLRAIDQRAKKKAHTEPETPPSNFATKDDLKTLATNDAKKLVAPEVKEMWDELTAIPLGGFDSMDSESIAANMQQRYNLYKIEHPDDEEDPSKELTTSPDTSVSKGSTPKTKVVKKEVNLPGYKEPAQPADWYPE